MKKIIAIAVVFILVAGIALAEINVSGEVHGKVTLGEGSTLKDSETSASGGLSKARVQTEGQNEEGTFGGWTRFETGRFGGGVNGHGLVWWKPIEQLKIQLGANPDGHFGADGFSRWGFYQVAADVGVATEEWAFDSMYGGMGAFGAYLFITPMDGLDISIGIPFAGGGNPKYTYYKTNAQIAYTIGGIGKFAISYQGDLGDSINVGISDGKYADEFAAMAAIDNTSYGANGSNLYAFFDLTAVENLGVNFGVKFAFPVKSDTISFTYKDLSDNEHEVSFPIGALLGDDITVNPPMSIGLGLRYNAGAFGVKARVNAKLGGTVQMKGRDDWKSDTNILFDILPSFAVNDSLSVLLSAGLQITSPGDNDYGSADKPDTVTSWHINPYISFKSGWWAPSFYAGFRMESDGRKGSSGDGDASKIDWKIPVGMAFSF